jgi:hypothetical protein
MSTIFAYLISRLSEPTTRAALASWLTATVGAVVSGGDYVTIALVSVSALGGILCPEAKPALDALDIVVTKARGSVPPSVPPSGGAAASVAASLVIGVGLALSACTPAEQSAVVTAACAADQAAHPEILAAATAAGGVPGAVADEAAYAGLSAACAAALKAGP